MGLWLATLSICAPLLFPISLYILWCVCVCVVLDRNHDGQIDAGELGRVLGNGGPSMTAMLNEVGDDGSIRSASVCVCVCVCHPSVC